MDAEEFVHHPLPLQESIVPAGQIDLMRQLMSVKGYAYIIKPEGWWWCKGSVTFIYRCQIWHKIEITEELMIDDGTMIRPKKWRSILSKQHD